jgi:hypothetical protein
LPPFATAALPRSSAAAARLRAETVVAFGPFFVAAKGSAYCASPAPPEVTAFVLDPPLDPPPQPPTTSATPAMASPELSRGTVTISERTTDPGLRGTPLGASPGCAMIPG